MTEEEILAHADTVIPGIDNPTKFKASELVQVVSVEV